MIKLITNLKKVAKSYSTQFVCNVARNTLVNLMIMVTIMEKSYPVISSPDNFQTIKYG